MYWWNLNGLVKDLKEGRFTQRDAKAYYLAAGIGMAVVLAFAQADIFSIIGLLFTIPFTIWFINSCFHINVAGDNKDFLERMISLSWVCGFRIFAITIAPMILVALVAYGSGGRLGQVVAAHLMAIGLEIAIALYIRSQIKKVASRSTHQ